MPFQQTISPFVVVGPQAPMTSPGAPRAYVMGHPIAFPSGMAMLGKKLVLQLEPHLPAEPMGPIVGQSETAKQKDGHHECANHKHHGAGTKAKWRRIRGQNPHIADLR